MLLGGLQEQHDRIDAQQNEIEALRAENEATQERLALLEAQVEGDASAIAGWSGWGAVGLLMLLVLGGVLLRWRQGAVLAAVLLAGLWALPAQAQTPVVEAKNADETTVLQVNADGSLLGLGVFDTGVIPVEGAGIRLVWHPAKAAFRAGRVGVSFNSDGTEWDDANVGAYSVAFGRDTEASGFASTAMGRRTTASGSGSTAMGRDTEASGSGSTAMGLFTEASGFQSTAMGRDTEASGRYSTAMGLQTTAQAATSLVIGRNNVVAGDVDEWVPTDPLFVAGNGNSTVSRSNALTLLKNGDLTIAGDLTESSDRRLKTDVAPLVGVLAALDGIQPVRYRFKDRTSRPAGPQLGLIAQEVEAVFPELVTRGADGYLSVAYPKLTAVLLKGLQEQQAQIDTLRAQNEVLQEQVRQMQSMQQRVDRLEAQFEQRATVEDVASLATGKVEPPR